MLNTLVDNVLSDADLDIFQRGGGLRRKILKYICLMIHVSTRFKKNETNMQPFLSSSFSRGLSSIFCFVLSLFFIFEISKEGLQPP